MGWVIGSGTGGEIGDGAGGAEWILRLVGNGQMFMNLAQFPENQDGEDGADENGGVGAVTDQIHFELCGGQVLLGLINQVLKFRCHGMNLLVWSKDAGEETRRQVQMKHGERRNLLFSFLVLSTLGS